MLSSRSCQLTRDGTYTLIECQTACVNDGPGLGCSGPFCMGAYFPNWAQYRDYPWTFTTEQLKGVLPMYDYLVYAFAKFDPVTFEVTGTEEANGTIKDVEQMNKIKEAAAEVGKPDFKLLLSIGGWSFPAAYWSNALATAANRSKLITECVKYLETNNLQGIDIDWEFPGAAPTTKYVQKAHACFNNGVSCTELNDASIESGPVDGVCVIQDAGQADGVDDFANLGLFVQEASVVFRSHTPPFMLTIAAAANPLSIVKYDFPKMIPAIDVWHIMAYDFWVSDTEDKAFSGCTAPSAPLYAPDFNAVNQTQTVSDRNRSKSRLDASKTCTPTGADLNLSIDNAVTLYLQAGVNPKKMMLGLAFYGHTWYVPGLTGDEYARFGISSEKENLCCGPLGTTYGGTGGKSAVLCGSLLYSEIHLNRNNLQITEDAQTQSTIGYWAQNSGGYTDVPAGTWVSFNSPSSIAAITQYAMSKGLRGVFAWDISSDTVLPFFYDLKKKPVWTFDLSTVIHNTLNNTIDEVCGSSSCPSPSFCVNENGSPVCYCGDGVVYDATTGCEYIPPTPPPLTYAGICPKTATSNACTPCNEKADCGGTTECYGTVDQNCCVDACSWNGTCTPVWNEDHSKLSSLSCVCKESWTGENCSTPAGPPPPPPPPPPTTTCPADCHFCYDSDAKACMDASHTEAECKAWGPPRYTWCG